MDTIGLGLDTTFDDTSVAILRGKREILANLTLSQYQEHEEFGGVVPERASRKHLEVIHHLISAVLKEADLEFSRIDYIAVSNLPGLLGSLLVGLTVAKSLAYTLQCPLIGVNHVESHPYANVLVHGEMQFPILHLVVAGGHTLLIHARDHFDYEIIGRSVDDAAGECVDKVAKMFGYQMPGGPVVDRAALEYSGDEYDFPRPLMYKNGHNFSFSGLKTAMLRFREKHHDSSVLNKELQMLIQEEGPILASFFQSVVDVLLYKTFKAAEEKGLKNISVSGGLAASRKLNSAFEKEAKRRGVKLFYPPASLCTDNAAMVTCLAAHRFAAQQFDDLTLDAYPNIV
ncbi:MAG: tRNA (adenosine(37)-N6)-threonylcarbamoyltransferase complex transferase subunit TsaD [SAR324 cluster bacterium]|nr:tRNA (adenosine(37)-N6)-threonylcarbamoyltransferase complex transferase subunit TsaD [SAR324 cluster bacterium]MBL7035844.1 tRNA (adenosine(37)-N6)-threonylcarbamoyltransferase complex transferase subunit TsaD [SAR324 cluster bacterium]